jgi:transposase
MDAVFSHNPNDPLQCPHQYACPHLGGASLSWVVAVGNGARQQANQYFREMERLRKEISLRDKQIDELQLEIKDLRQELKAVHRRAFHKNRRTSEEAKEQPQTAVTAATASTEATARKRGAPVGHPGWYRRLPNHVDRTVDVPVAQCPHCGSCQLQPSDAVFNHIQEDVINGRVEVVCFRHPLTRCPTCGKNVLVAGPGELLGCPIGPHAKAIASYLHYDVDLSCRKVQAVCQELLGLKFSVAAVIGFDQQAARRAQPLADDIAAKLHFCMVVYADETYWQIDGRSAYVWFHGNDDLAFFHLDVSRAGIVSRKILGVKFDGALVTDCYGGYEKHATKIKQKCLSHLKRTAEEWGELVPPDSQAAVFFLAVRAWVRRACCLHRGWSPSVGWTAEQGLEIAWLRAELLRLQMLPLDHARAKRLQKRLTKYHDQWLTFIDHPEVSPTNNLAERALRPLVILRKVTFGNRSAAGAQRLGTMASVLETAKRQGHSALAFLRQLFLRNKEHLLVALYRPSG